jgi:hypothetical protein
MRIGPVRLCGQNCRRDWVVEHSATGHPCGGEDHAMIYMFTSLGAARGWKRIFRPTRNYRIAELTREHRRHAYDGRVA